MKKAIIVLGIAIIILPFMAVNMTDTTTTKAIHETKKATTTTQADTNNNNNNNGNNTPVKHDNNADNNNNKTCNHNYIEDSYITPYGHYSGYVCIYCNEGYYHLIDTETNTDTNKPTTTDNDATTTTDAEKTNYSMSKVDYNNALYDYEIENGLYCEAREHYDESGNHTEADCNYKGGLE